MELSAATRIVACLRGRPIFSVACGLYLNSGSCGSVTQESPRSLTTNPESPSLIASSGACLQLPPFEPLDSCLLLLESSLSSGLNFQAPRMVVRGAGSGAGFDPFAAVAGAACDGAAVMGPGGACAVVASAASRPSAANPVSTVSLKKQMALMFNPEFLKSAIHVFPS